MESDYTKEYLLVYVNERIRRADMVLKVTRKNTAPYNAITGYVNAFSELKHDIENGVL